MIKWLIALPILSALVLVALAVLSVVYDDFFRKSPKCPECGYPFNPFNGLYKICAGCDGRRLTLTCENNTRECR